MITGVPPRCLSSFLSRRERAQHSIPLLVDFHEISRTRAFHDVKKALEKYVPICFLETRRDLNPALKIVLIVFEINHETTDRGDPRLLCTRCSLCFGSLREAQCE